MSLQLQAVVIAPTNRQPPLYEDQNVFISRIRRLIDDYLSTSQEDRGLVISPEIIAWAYGSHAYMMMSADDRSRLNRIRLEIERIQNRIENNRHHDQDGIPICQVCYEDVRNQAKHFVSLICGHVMCQNKTEANCNENKTKKWLFSYVPSEKNSLKRYILQ